MSTNPIPTEAKESAKAALLAEFGRKASAHDYHVMLVVLSAAAPAIRAQAKAEAWDEVIVRIDLGTPHMVDEKYVAGANWVRSQIEDVLKAATIEGKDS